MSGFAELYCDKVDTQFQLKRPGRKTLIIKGFEAGVISFLREDLNIKEKVQLLNIKPEDLESYIDERKKSYKEYCLEILSSKWYYRISDVKLKITTTEFEELDFKTFYVLKQECKKGNLTIKEMVTIIEYFTNDFSDYYLKD